MSGITKILTRTPGELGSIKTNKSPIVEENKQLPAEQWNTAADAIIEIQTVIGEAANPAAGTIMDVLNDHEERIDELEQSGGGGGGTPGHVICNVVEDDPPIEPVPQRKNLVFFSNTDEVVVQDFEELDATIVSFSSISSEEPYRVYSRATDDPNSMTYAQAGVSASYHEGESHTGFHVDLYDHDGEGSYIHFDRQPDGERFVVGLGYQPGDLRFVVNNHTSFGDKEFSLSGAPTLIETPTKPMHAATKGYVDDRVTTLEWWEPVWTPVENVDFVGNVECQYTRTYRAAGGSLVTLEGTVMVTPDAAGQCVVQADLPIERVGVVPIPGTAMAMEVTPPGHVVAAASVDSTTLTLGFVAEGADPYLVGFRVSYRAA